MFKNFIKADIAGQYACSILNINNVLAACTPNTFDKIIIWFRINLSLRLPVS
ncbi:uncharacterized protein METZ01_LOCUS80895 [marine metagenome]|uniref:Uncharacterized protein n=1 Tax=marine metagenome TaxID=408172 RepID=A0A381UJY0_9ZZZZ